MKDIRNVDWPKFRHMVSRIPSQTLWELIRGLQLEMTSKGLKLPEPLFHDWVRRQGAMEGELVRRGWLTKKNKGDFTRELLKERKTKIFPVS